MIDRLVEGAQERADEQAKQPSVEASVLDAGVVALGEAVVAGQGCEQFRERVYNFV